MGHFSNRDNESEILIGWNKLFIAKSKHRGYGKDMTKTIVICDVTENNRGTCECSKILFPTQLRFRRQREAPAAPQKRTIFFPWQIVASVEKASQSGFSIIEIISKVKASKNLSPIRGRVLEIRFDRWFWLRLPGHIFTFQVSRFTFHAWNHFQWDFNVATVTEFTFHLLLFTWKGNRARGKIGDVKRSRKWN